MKISYDIIPKKSATKVFQLAHYMFSDACAIDMRDSVIFTGGTDRRSMVTEVRIDGSSTDLPELNEERTNHGCTSYLDEYGNKVKILIQQMLTLT